VLEKIGGPAKSSGLTATTGRSRPTRLISGTSASKDASDVAENMGRWRVEVKPGTPRTEDMFLHLIQASDQTTAKMVETRVSEKGEQIELTFTAGVRTYTVGLNKTGDVGGHLRITEDGKVFVRPEPDAGSSAARRVWLRCKDGLLIVPDGMAFRPALVAAEAALVTPEPAATVVRCSVEHSGGFLRGVRASRSWPNLS